MLFVGFDQFIDVIEHGNFNWLYELIAFLDSVIDRVQRFYDKTVIAKHKLLPKEKTRKRLSTPASPLSIPTTKSLWCILVGYSHPDRSVDNVFGGERFSPRIDIKNYRYVLCFGYDYNSTVKNATL